MAIVRSGAGTSTETLQLFTGRGGVPTAIPAARVSAHPRSRPGCGPDVAGAGHPDRGPARPSAGVLRHDESGRAPGDRPEPHLRRTRLRPGSRRRPRLVSPGNKDSHHAIKAFTAKAIDFLRSGISLVIIDLFPPTPRDPAGIHQLIWDELSGVPFEPRPADKPLTVVSYDGGNGLTAYVDPVAVGDPLPDVPVFLTPGWYVNLPLEQTYLASWEVTPKPIRDLLAPL